MVEVKFPGLTLPGTIKAGILLNVSLFGVKFRIPPDDIVLWKEPLKIWDPFVLFDTDDIAKAVTVPVAGIAEAVVNLAKAKLDELAADYYERHSEET